MEMKSSGSPLPLHIHHPVSAGWVDTPQESIWRSKWIGAALWGLAFLYSHVVWYKNILYFKSLLTVTTSDLHRKTKRNSINTLWICTWKSQMHYMPSLSQQNLPSFVWSRDWHCLSEHCGEEFWLLRLCSCAWVSSGSAAHWEPLHCHHLPTILTRLRWECCHGSCWNWYCLLSARWSKTGHWVSGFGTPGTCTQPPQIPSAAPPQW